MTDTTQGQDGYSGQQGLTDPGSEFNVFCFIVQQLLGKVRTLVPVKVTAVHAGERLAAGTVDVQPLVNQVDGIGNKTEHGIVLGIPVFRLQAGSFAIILDPQVDDLGFVVCADRDISAVKANKAISNPGSKRRFSLADGVYFGGMLNAAPDQYIKFSSDGVTIADKFGHKIESTSAGKHPTGEKKHKRGLSRAAR